jgi:hypothetical protein
MLMMEKGVGVIIIPVYDQCDVAAMPAFILSHWRKAGCGL